MGDVLPGLADWKRRRTLRRVSGHLWTSDDPFDFDNKEPADYYRVYFEDQAGEPHARIVSLAGNTASIRLWNGEKFEGDEEVAVESLAAFPLRVVRSYHGIRIKYVSEAEFLLIDWWYPLFVRLREWLFQSTYQLTTRTRAERLDVLAAILDKRLNDNSFEYILENDTVTSEEVMVRMFGRRVLNHSDGGRISSRIDLILKSLVESGDVEQVNDHRFRPRGQAITTVSQAATDDRRHRTTTRLTVALVVLTAALVVTGLLAIDPARLLSWTSCFVPVAK